MTRLQVKNIKKNYHRKQGETEAIRDVSFEVNTGEFITIVGPSGCGKSTILNLIAKLNHMSSGEILLNGEEIEKGTDKIGYMFQRDNLFDWLTVYENVTLGLRLKKKLNRETKEKAISLLKEYDLEEFMDSFPRELSGGMRQRVALIRTLTLNPELLILDEPFSALDYVTRLKVSDEIYSIIKNEGKTVLMVTHDIGEAISLSDRVIILSNRPAVVNVLMDIHFDEKYDLPFKKREAPEFKDYFQKIWKELEVDGEEN